MDTTTTTTTTTTLAGNNKLQQNLVEDASHQVIIKSTNDGNGNKSPPKRNYCSIISIILISTIVLTLLGVAIYYIAVTPQISKSLRSLPENGYLYMIDLNEISPTKECNELTLDDLKKMLTGLISLKKYGINSFAFHCHQMSTPSGVVDGMVKPLEEILTSANRLGISIGVIISQEHLKHPTYLESIKNLPFMAFYHYITNIDDVTYDQQIKEFGLKFIEEEKYLIKRTNNLIIEQSDFTKIKSAKGRFGDAINALVVPVTSLSVDADQHENYETKSLIFMPGGLTISDNKLKPPPYTNALDQIMLISRSMFLSNSSAIFTCVDQPIMDISRKLSENITISDDELHFFTYLKDFAMLIVKTELWDKVQRLVKVTNVTSFENVAVSYSYEVAQEKNSKFTHLVLLQNTADGASSNEFTYSLQNFDFSSNSNAQVLISSPQPYLAKTTTNIQTNSITLPRHGSIVLAIYNDEHSKILTHVHKSWPIVTQPISP